MDISLILAIAALGLAAVAVFRAYVPPQTRLVNELAAHVAELQSSVDEFARRLTARSKKENMEVARNAHESARERRKAIEEEAALIIATKNAPPTVPPGPEAEKARLRALTMFRGRS